VGGLIALAAPGLLGAGEFIVVVGYNSELELDIEPMVPLTCGLGVHMKTRSDIT